MAFSSIFSEKELKSLIPTDAQKPPLLGDFPSDDFERSYHQNVIYFFAPTSFLTNGVKLIDIFVHFFYFWTYLRSWKLTHSMFLIIANQSIILSISTFFSMILLIVGGFLNTPEDVKINEKFLKTEDFLLELSKYLDFSQKFFDFLMLYPLAFNQLLSYMHRGWWWRIYEKSRIIVLVSFCILLSATASVILIQTSEMKRLYIPRVGFVDSGSPGYQMLINRLFYIFPVGSIICYIVLYFHIRRMTQRVMSRRTAQNGEQKVFIQLLITVCFYGAMCILFEVINAIEFTKNTAQRIDLVSVLNIINYLPEISLPLMLLLSNTDMRRRISTIMAPRGSQSHTVSVIPVT